MDQVKVVKLCKFQAWHTLLAAGLFLVVASGTAAESVYAKNASRKGANDLPLEQVQQLLSDQAIEDTDAVRLIFKQGDDALPTVLTALRQGKNVERASRAVAYLGSAKDREVLRGVIAAEKNQETKWLMASVLAGALVEPASPEEWSFLKDCLRGYSDENKAFVSFSAALALGANASPQALDLLQSVVSPGDSSNTDNDAVMEMRQAIHCIEQRSTSSRKGAVFEKESDSEQIKGIVAESVFCTDEEREHLSVENVVFNGSRVRALASVEIYRGPKNAQNYDVVLERKASGWKIVGVWFSWAA